MNMAREPVDATLHEIGILAPGYWNRGVCHGCGRSEVEKGIELVFHSHDLPLVPARNDVVPIDWRIARDHSQLFGFGE
jgi:hypothetical protein